VSVNLLPELQPVGGMRTNRIPKASFYLLEAYAKVGKGRFQDAEVVLRAGSEMSRTYFNDCLVMVYEGALLVNCTLEACTVKFENFEAFKFCRFELCRSIYLPSVGSLESADDPIDWTGNGT
jgi:hypothetical protein